MSGGANWHLCPRRFPVPATLLKSSPCDACEIERTKNGRASLLHCKYPANGYSSQPRVTRARIYLYVKDSAKERRTYNREQGARHQLTYMP